MTDDASSAERAAVVKWLREQEAFHEETYQHARKRDDQPGMDRCAARARSYAYADDAIERGDHLIGVDPQEHLARRLDETDR